MEEILVGIELAEGISAPFYKHDGDAGMDIRAAQDIIIAPGQTVIIPTGIKIAVPLGLEMQVRPRSGLSAKTPIRVANAPGTVDSLYRDTVGVIITNTSRDYYWDKNENGEDVIKKIPETQTFTLEDEGKDGYCVIKAGDRIAQIVLNEIKKIDWKETDDITSFEGNRGGGYGHSGVK